MKHRSPMGRRLLLSSIASLAVVNADARTDAPSGVGQTNPNPSAPHKIVYQLNKADDAYQEAIFNSISAMLTKYVDDVAIAVVAWGPGLHLLAKVPKRPVPKLYQQRVRSMAESYGVRFIACGNTMHSLGWTPADMLDFVKVEDVGAAAVMELQEQGYAYLAW
jgi:intracellular sulfur oxidation DsrE/DsrF family protein